MNKVEEIRNLLRDGDHSRALMRLRRKEDPAILSYVEEDLTSKFPGLEGRIKRHLKNKHYAALSFEVKHHFEGISQNTFAEEFCSKMGDRWFPLRLPDTGYIGFKYGGRTLIFPKSGKREMLLMMWLDSEEAPVAKITPEEGGAFAIACTDRYVSNDDNQIRFQILEECMRVLGKDIESMSISTDYDLYQATPFKNISHAFEITEADPLSYFESDNGALEMIFEGVASYEKTITEILKDMAVGLVPETAKQTLKGFKDRNPERIQRIFGANLCNLPFQKKFKKHYAKKDAQWSPSSYDITSNEFALHHSSGGYNRAVIRMLDKGRIEVVFNEEGFLDAFSKVGSAVYEKGRWVLDCPYSVPGKLFQDFFGPFGIEDLKEIDGRVTLGKWSYSYISDYP